ncbi:MAG: 30S ribosome-binding factor RbfA [Firmicutes bacterium]|nr:30S ribosome-binding factor RbfA [Bacillota bacterium]
MIKKHHRSQRLEGELMKVLAEIIREDLKDPRLHMITITDVSVAKDLSFAKIFISHLEEDKAKAGLEALNKGKGFIRKQIGMKLKLRIVPEIAFYIDDTLNYSLKINKILKSFEKEEKE